jgi:hypothetical protein
VSLTLAFGVHSGVVPWIRLAGTYAVYIPLAWAWEYLGFRSLAQHLGLSTHTHKRASQNARRTINQIHARQGRLEHWKEQRSVIAAKRRNLGAHVEGLV